MILTISRDWGVDPSIVRITTDDNLAAITTTGYLTAQEATIEALNNGAFEWVDTDEILIAYSGGEGFFTRDATNNTFVAAPSTPGSLSDTLADGNIFVGNALNVATGVTPSGDITLTNTGVFGIAPGVIVNADINAAAAIAFSKLAALPSADILVGSAGNVATAVAVTGDITVNNTGVTAIGAGKITNTMVNAAAAIDFSKLAALPSADILVGSAGNVPTAVAVTGDVTISNAGVTAIGANKVLSTMMSPLLMKYATATVSAAEFNGMFAAPKLLLAAGGANTLIVLHRAQLVMTFVSAAYANGGVVTIQYDTTVNGAGVAASNTEAAADFFAAASTAFQFEGVSGNTVAISPFTTSVNKGLYLSNQTGAFTTGDSTWVVHLWYSIIPTV
jgi:hypothetical protein